LDHAEKAEECGQSKFEDRDGEMALAAAMWNIRKDPRIETQVPEFCVQSHICIG
jgi:hypothetical protein